MSIKSEEFFEKWRRPETEMNNGEQNSPTLSRNQQHQRREEDIILLDTRDKPSTLISVKHEEHMKNTNVIATTKEGTSASTSSSSSSFHNISASASTLATKGKSPQRIYDDSDDATYDSYHFRETDYCRDSTDDVSDSESSTFEIMEVVEYEVASISENEALYSNDSSSGTDDFLLTAVATTAAAICQSTNYFADTEDSNSENGYGYDPELGLADYWKCVKCKNKQNNPMFRYCEKCYQIRKSHFPPRPRKGNLKRKRNSSPNFAGVIAAQNPNTIESNDNHCPTNDGELSKSTPDSAENVKDEVEKRLSGSDSDGHSSNGGGGGGSSSDLEHSLVNSKFQNDSSGRIKYKKRKFNRSTINSNNGDLYSSRSSSCSNTAALMSSNENCSTESSDTEIEVEYTRNSRGNRKRKISPKMKGNNKNNNNASCSNSNNNNINNNNNNNDSCSSSGGSNHMAKKRKLSNLNVKVVDEGKMPSSSSINANDKFVNSSEIKIFSSAIHKFSDSEHPGALSSPYLSMLKIDSGISSAAPSSQEMPSSLSSNSDDPQISINNIYSEHDDDDSDTVCEELNDNDIKEIEKTYSTNLKNSISLASSSSLVRQEKQPQQSCSSTTPTTNNNNNNQFTPIIKSNSGCFIKNVSMIRRSISDSSQISLRNFPINEKDEKEQNHTSSSVLTSKITSTSSKKIKNTNSTDLSDSDQCVVCFSEPKNGAFIHTKCAHLCCCYKCAVKIWNTRKKCPICNGSVKNVLKLFVH